MRIRGLLPGWRSFQTVAFTIRTLCFGVSQVNELTMQNEYQLRLKDMTMNERIKEMSDKFAHELVAPLLPLIASSRRTKYTYIHLYTYIYMGVRH